jgi:hypothetical protein
MGEFDRPPGICNHTFMKGSVLYRRHTRPLLSAIALSPFVRLSKRFRALARLRTKRGLRRCMA